MDNDDDTGTDTGGDNATPQPPAVADLEPGTSRWRVWVAMAAHEFFKMPHNPNFAAVIGKAADLTTFDVWSVADYSKYLHTRGLRDAGNVVELTQITRALEHVGFLLRCGTANLPFMGEQFLTQGGASPGQVGGNLWLSGIFGAELIIASYTTVTVQISGTDAAGNPHWGSGLVMDHTHIVTNKHVVTAIAGGSSLSVDR